MRQKLGIALLVAGVLCAVPFVVRVVTSTAGSITAPSHRTPFEIEQDLDAGRYVLFERTGTGANAGPISGSVNGAPTISPDVVDITAPDGVRLPTSYLDGASETITQGNRIYTGVVEFSAAEDGRYGIAVGGEGRDVIVSRSIASTFRGLAAVFGVAVFGGLLFLSGLALVVLDATRRRGKPAPASVPPAGWYADADAGGGERLRYWDGEAWTDHTSP